MSDKKERDVNLLIIRRNGSAELDSPKGGVWKIAYADFMTAMMAFFLVMWLINATSETTKTGVANYFNPIKLSEGKLLPRKGLHDPDVTEPSTAAAEQDQAEQDRGEQHGAEQHEASPPPAAEAQAEEGAAVETIEAARSEGKIARYSEDALFRDPYAVLAAIAAEADGASSLEPADGAASSGSGAADPIGSETYNDPFDPAAWQTAARIAGDNPLTSLEPSDQRASDEPGAPSANQAFEQHASPLSGETALGTQPMPLPSEAPGSHGENGVGQDGTGAVTGAEAARLQAQLVEALNEEAAARRLPNVTITEANGGVLISLADQIDFGMFAIGSAEPLPETIAVMEKIAEMLKSLPGKVIIRGHTDGRPFRSDVYDNWRLSAARAHMAYHMLVHGGLDEMRVERIEGYADRDLKLPEDPEAAENRRIDILVQEVAS